MSVVTAHQTDLTTFCKFKREHKLRRALHLLLNLNSFVVSSGRYVAIGFVGDIQRGHNVHHVHTV